MAILAIDLLDCCLLLILKDQLDELIVLVEKNIDRMSLMGGLLVLTNPYLRGTILGVVFDRGLVFVPLKALIGQLLLEAFSWSFWFLHPACLWWQKLLRCPLTSVTIIILRVIFHYYIYFRDNIFLAIAFTCPLSYCGPLITSAVTPMGIRCGCMCRCEI